MTLLPNGRDQLKYVEETSFPLAEGDSWYLVEIKWYLKWKNVCASIQCAENDFQSAQVGPIENDLLCNMDGRLKDKLIENQDYRLFSKPSWTRLCEWYGVKGPELERRAVKARGKVMVEVYPLSLIVYEHQNPTVKANITISKAESVSKLKSIALSHFDIVLNAHKVRLGLVIDGVPAFLLDDSLSSLEEAAIEDGNTVVVELMKSDETWPISYSPTKDEMDEDEEDEKNLYGYSIASGSSVCLSLPHNKHLKSL